jgi:hypothetical protein
MSVGVKAQCVRTCVGECRSVCIEGDGKQPNGSGSHQLLRAMVRVRVKVRVRVRVSNRMGVGWGVTSCTRHQVE